MKLVKLISRALLFTLILLTAHAAHAQTDSLDKYAEQRAQADKILAEADQLSNQQTAAAAETAIIKYQDAATIYHSLPEPKDHDNEAYALANIGFIYGSLSNYRKAIDFCDRALVIL